MLSRASAAIHLCLVIDCGLWFGKLAAFFRQKRNGGQAFNHAAIFGGANGFSGFSGNSRADIHQCMIHLSQLTNSF